MTHELERLHKIFAEQKGEPAAGDQPDPETIWRAVAGELPRAELEGLTDRLAEDPQLAAEWRIALELHRAQVSSSGGSLAEMPRRAEEAPTSRRQKPRNPRWLMAAAVVATVVGALFVYRTQLPEPAPTIYRGAEEATIGSLVGEELPRERFVLEWTPGAEGTIYELVVSDSELQILVTLRKLYDPKAQVPAADLASLPAGSTVRWQIVATDPDGRQHRSPTFETRVR